MIVFRSKLNVKMKPSGIIVIAAIIFICSIKTVAGVEIAAPIHCHSACYSDTIYYAGDTLEGCINATAAICGANTTCGKNGEECISCCDEYCNNANLPNDKAVYSCKKSCMNACNINSIINAAIDFIKNVAIIIAAIIFSLCGIRLLLSSDPSSRDQAKKCIVMVIIALLILGISIELIRLFYKPKRETAEVVPYIDILEFKVRGVIGNVFPPANIYKVSIKFRDAWLPTSDVRIKVTNTKRFPPKGINCITEDEKYIGNMDVGQIERYSNDGFCYDTFLVNFTSKEGSWAYLVECNIFGRLNVWSKCHISQMFLSLSPEYEPFTGDCSKYSTREKCESTGECWWDDHSLGEFEGECKSCDLIDSCDDYPARGPEDGAQFDEWRYRFPDNRCPVCMRNPCKVPEKCTIAIDYTQVPNADCALCREFGYRYWRFFPYGCFECDEVVTCCAGKGVDECSDYEVPSSCECDTCLQNECWTGEYIDITAISKSGGDASENSVLNLTCGDLTVWGKIINIDGNKVTFRISRDDLEKLNEKGCKIDGL